MTPAAAAPGDTAGHAGAAPAAWHGADIDALVRRDQVLGLYQHEVRGRPVGWALLLGLPLLAGRQAGVAATLAWVLVNALALAVAYHRQRGFAAAVATGIWDPEAWARRNRRGVALSALALGLAMWCFYGQLQSDLRLAVLVVLLATAAGGIHACGHDLRSVQACIVGIGLPMLAWMLAVGLQRPGGAVGTALFLAYMGMLLRFGRLHAGLLADSLRMRHEQRALVAQLQRKTAEAEQAAQAKSAFFAAASHDLRQPLQALTWYAGLLGQPDAPPQVADRLREGIAALGRLFDGILGIARLDAGKVQAEPQPVPLAPLVARVAAQFEGQAAQQGLALRWRVPAPACARSDPLLLERMLSNLLSNALRYTPRGGVLVAARRRGGHWRLQVWDTGIGIAPADQQRVFEEFVQVGNRQRDAARGVGLGLSTTRRLATLLGHGLALHSRPGRGSCFTLVMQAEADLAPAGNRAVDPASPDAGPLPAAPATSALHRRVLLVDDHAAARDALRWTLQRWGLDCDAAGNATDALALAGQHRYDVLLCDQRLPEGLASDVLLLRLLALQPAARLVAVVSGDPPPSDWPGPLRPAPHWLSKPVRPMALRALLMHALPPD